MHVTLVKNREDHVHHKHRERHQDRQTRNRATKRQRLTLQLRTHSRRNDLRRRIRDVVRRIAERDARLEIEEERHARELVQVVHGLWTQRRLPRYQLTERHEFAAVIRLDVEQRQVLRLLTHGVFHLENHLVLILGLLDQVGVVLRVGVTQQVKNARL